MINTPTAQGLVQAVKTVLKKTVYRPGRIVHVLRGPLRGYRFILRETPNWSSIIGRWEPELSRIYAALIQPGQVVYDCGANVGMHTLHFSRLVGPTGKVYAFEPLPMAARDVLLNCALNDVPNVTLLEAALADQLGEAEFELGETTTVGRLSGSGRAGGQRLKVRVTTLDQVIADGAPAPDFVKMDIEGAEGSALAGFERVTQGYPSFAIASHAPEQDLLVGAFLVRHGYRVYRVGDDLARKAGQTALLQPIQTFERGWPEPGGIWGTVIAIHPSRKQQEAQLRRLAGL